MENHHVYRVVINRFDWAKAWWGCLPIGGTSKCRRRLALPVAPYWERGPWCWVRAALNGRSRWDGRPHNVLGMWHVFWRLFGWNIHDYVYKWSVIFIFNDRYIYIYYIHILYYCSMISKTYNYRQTIHTVPCNVEYIILYDNISYIFI